MYSTQDVLAGVKSLFGVESHEELSHCQKLDLYSKKLGFQSYHHLKSILQSLTDEEAPYLSQLIMRLICSRKLPSDTSTYYEFEYDIPVLKSPNFYSYWIGYDADKNELREPRPLNGACRVEEVRDTLYRPYYVLETEKDLEYWMSMWGGRALIPEHIVINTPDLLDCFIKRFKDSK